LSSSAIQSVDTAPVFPDHKVKGGLGAGSGELGDDGGVCVETDQFFITVVNDGNLQIVSGHAWLSWDTGRDRLNRAGAWT